MLKKSTYHIIPTSRESFSNSKVVKNLMLPFLAIAMSFASFVDLYQTYTEGMSKYVAVAIEFAISILLFYFWYRLMTKDGEEQIVLYKDRCFELSAPILNEVMLILLSLAMVFRTYTEMRMKGPNDESLCPLSTLLLILCAIGVAIVVFLFIAELHLGELGADADRLGAYLHIGMIIVYTLALVGLFVESSITLFSLFQFIFCLSYLLSSLSFFTKFSYEFICDEAVDEKKAEIQIGKEQTTPR